MADPLAESLEKNCSRSLTLDIHLTSPDGKALTMVITGDEDQAGFMLDLLENAEEYLQWIQTGRMGDTPPGIFH